MIRITRVTSNIFFSHAKDYFSENFSQEKWRGKQNSSTRFTETRGEQWLSMNYNGSIQNAKENSHCFILSAENLLAHCIPVTGSRMGELRPLYARQKGGNSMPIAILYSKFSSTNLQNVMTVTLVSGYTGWELFKWKTRKYISVIFDFSLVEGVVIWLEVF